MRAKKIWLALAALGALLVGAFQNCAKSDKGKDAYVSCVVAENDFNCAQAPDDTGTCANDRMTVYTSNPPESYGCIMEL